MSKYRTCAAGGVIAVAAVLALAGCGGGSSPSKTSTPAPLSTPAQSSTPAPTTTAPKTPDEIARVQAVALVRKYQQVVNDAYIKPKTAAALNTVTMDEELAARIRGLNLLFQMGGTQTGESKIVTITPGAVNLTFKPHATPRILPTVMVISCVDVRDVKAVDAKGHSLVPADRPPFYIETLSVKNFEPGNAQTWRVAVRRTKGAASCAGT